MRKKIAPEKSEEKFEKNDLFKRFEDIGLSKDDLSAKDIYLSESSKGKENEEVNLNIVIGRKESSVGYAYARELTHPRHNFEALTVILEPNLTVKPSTILVPAIKLSNLRQANMIYGPAQSAIGKAITDSIKSGIINENMLNDYIIITKIFINPNTTHRNILYKNCYDAMFDALKKALTKAEAGYNLSLQK